MAWLLRQCLKIFAQKLKHDKHNKDRHNFTHQAAPTAVCRGRFSPNSSAGPAQSAPVSITDSGLSAGRLWQDHACKLLAGGMRYSRHPGKAGTEGAAASASVGPATGKQAKANYRKGMTVFAHTKGGLMYEAAIGGQKFKFKPNEAKK
jgi:hypothetical protein